LALLSFEAVLFSCTRMVMMSPTARARLSADIERWDSSEPGPAWTETCAKRAKQAARRSKLFKEEGTANLNLRMENLGSPALARFCLVRAARVFRLEVDDDDLLILNFGIELTFRFWVALADGLPGQTVRVRNPKTKREFYAKVQDEQTVVINL